MTRSDVAGPTTFAQENNLGIDRVRAKGHRLPSLRGVGTRFNLKGEACHQRKRTVMLAQDANGKTGGEGAQPLGEELRRAKTLADLFEANSRAAQRIVDLARVGTKIPQLLILSSYLHDAITTRVIALLRSQPQFADLPGHFSLLALGSEGRREQLFRTDQDNAIVLGDTLPPLQRGAVCRFAQALIVALTTIGVPPCPGGTMASHDSWRKGVAEWIRDIDAWVATPRSENIIRFSTLLDMRTLYGDPDLERSLKEHIKTTVPRNSIFLAQLTRNILRFPTGIGFLGRVTVERSGPHQGTLDIKKRGIFLISECVKILALERGISESSTLGRLAQLEQLGAISGQYRSEVQQAFEQLLWIRVRHQIDEEQADESPSNHVNPAKLPVGDRKALRGGLLVAKSLKEMLHRRHCLA